MASRNIRVFSEFPLPISTKTHGLQTYDIISCNHIQSIVCEKGFNPFPHNDTFWCLWERSLLKSFGEKEKLLIQAISPFPTMFSTLTKTEIIIFVIFNLSSANAFNLVWSNILSCGKGLMNLQKCIDSSQPARTAIYRFYACLWTTLPLTLSQASPVFYVSAVQFFFLKTLRKEEKLLVKSNFSFSHSVFHPFGELSAIFIKFETVVCKLF